MACSNEVSFRITAASQGERVVVKVIYMDMERSYGCHNDYLNIYDDGTVYKQNIFSQIISQKCFNLLM